MRLEIVIIDSSACVCSRGRSLIKRPERNSFVKQFYWSVASSLLKTCSSIGRSIKFSGPSLKTGRICDLF